MQRDVQRDVPAAATVATPGQVSPSTRFGVIVGIDGSIASRVALAWAARYARATRSTLFAVRVLEWPVGFREDSTGHDDPVPHVPDTEVGRSYRRGMRRIFDEVDPRPEWRLGFAAGPTAAMLVHLVEDAELLVIGSRERAATGQAQAGGIAHYCASHSPRPVVIVPVDHLPRHGPVDQG